MKELQTNEQRYWDYEKEVGKGVPAPTGKSVIKTKITAKDGAEYVDLRKYVNRKGEAKGFNQHTTNGLAIDVNMLDAVIEALVKARDEYKNKAVKKTAKKLETTPVKTKKVM